MIKLNDNHKIITTFAIYLKKEEYVWSYITDVYPGEVTSRMRKVLGTYCCPFWLHITRTHEFKKIIRIEYYLETLQYSIQIRFVHFDFMVTKYQLFKFVRHKTWSTNVNGGDWLCLCFNRAPSLQSTGLRCRNFCWSQEMRRALWCAIGSAVMTPRAFFLNPEQSSAYPALHMRKTTSQWGRGSLYYYLLCFHCDPRKILIH